MSKKKFKKKGIERAIRKIFERQPDQKYTAKEISAILQITDKNMRKLVLSILKDLKNDKFLNEFQNGYFIINENYSTTFIGTVDSTARGAAYIMVPELNGDKIGRASCRERVEISSFADSAKENKNKA